MGTERRDRGRASGRCDHRGAARSPAQASEANRRRRELAYPAQLRTAVLRFLDFDEAHGKLAERIADEASARAAVVGSGRVGRMTKIGIEDRAALAARAYMRHRFTSYEDDLVDQLVWDDDFLYRDVKDAAQQAVDDFLAKHRLAPRLAVDGETAAQQWAARRLGPVRRAQGPSR